MFQSQSINAYTVCPNKLRTTFTLERERESLLDNTTKNKYDMKGSALFD